MRVSFVSLLVVIDLHHILAIFGFLRVPGLLVVALALVGLALLCSIGLLRVAHGSP